MTSYARTHRASVGGYEVALADLKGPLKTRSQSLVDTDALVRSARFRSNSLQPSRVSVRPFLAIISL